MRTNAPHKSFKPISGRAVEAANKKKRKKETEIKQQFKANTSAESPIKNLYT